MLTWQHRLRRMDTIQRSCQCKLVLGSRGVIQDGSLFIIIQRLTYHHFIYIYHHNFFPIPFLLGLFSFLVLSFSLVTCAIILSLFFFFAFSYVLVFSFLALSFLLVTCATSCAMFCITFCIAWHSLEAPILCKHVLEYQKGFFVVQREREREREGGGGGRGRGRGKGEGWREGEGERRERERERSCLG